MTEEATKVTVLGMSLRDYYAGLAMQMIYTDSVMMYSELADEAFKMANAMMKRRKEP